LTKRNQYVKTKKHNADHPIKDHQLSLQNYNQQLRGVQLSPGGITNSC